MVGETLPLGADVENPVFVQLYEVAAGLQLAVTVVDPPRFMLFAAAVSVQVGGWFTVTFADAVAPVPAAFVPDTVYVASVGGDTLPLEADDPKPLLPLQV